MKRIAFIVLLALIVVSCDDMQVVDMMSDLSGAPDDMVLIPAGEVSIGLSQHQFSPTQSAIWGRRVHSLVLLNPSNRPNHHTLCLTKQFTWTRSIWTDTR